MKKTAKLLLMIIFGVSLHAYSQTTPAGTFDGKWEISVTGTPAGDVKWVTNLTRKDGALTGEFSDALEPTQPKRPITRVQESADKLVLFFESSQAGEIAFDLKKVDNDHLEGTLMDSFNAKAVRIKE